MDIKQTSVKQVVQIITGLVDGGINDMPFFLSGSCGIGKTTVGHMIGEHYDLPVIEFRPAEIEAVELVGAPFLNEKERKVEFFRPEIVPTEKCVFLIDELTLAQPSVYSVLIKLVREGELGGVKLHPETIVIATGNRVSDRAGVNRISSALRESFVMFDVVPNLTQWLTYYGNHAETNETVWNFLSTNEDWFHQWDGKKESNQPCPRNWVKVGRVLGILAGSARRGLLSGIVGKAATNALLSFEKEFLNSVSVDDVLTGQKDLPTDPLLTGKFRQALVQRITTTKESKHVDSCADLLSQMTSSEIVPALGAIKAHDVDLIRNSKALSSLLLDHVSEINDAAF